jgi:hypothetical protein
MGIFNYSVTILHFDGEKTEGGWETLGFKTPTQYTSHGIARSNCKFRTLHTDRVKSSMLRGLSEV